jgi:hypothetical protein
MLTANPVVCFLEVSEAYSFWVIPVPQRQPRAGATVVRIASNTCAL